VSEFELIIMVANNEHISSTSSLAVKDILQHSRKRVKTWIFVLRSCFAALLLTVNRSNTRVTLSDKIFDDGADFRYKVETTIDSLKFSMVRRCLVNLEGWTRQLECKLYNTGIFASPESE